MLSLNPSLTEGRGERVFKSKVSLATDWLTTTGEDVKNDGCPATIGLTGITVVVKSKADPKIAFSIRPKKILHPQGEGYLVRLIIPRI